MTLGAHVVVLRYAEIFLKGHNRPFFESKLEHHVRRVLAGVEGARVRRVHGRVLVEVPTERLGRALDRLGRVFGVQTMSPARLVEPTLEAISAEAVAQAAEAVKKRGDRPTFKVETRRADKRFPTGSPEISREVGAAIVKELGLPVDVHRPQLEVGVEIGHERTFVYVETIPGPGGLPVGASGRVNLLLSGGIDSPVAGWLAMKRGCTVSATYFHSFPYTGDKTREKVLDLARLLAPWQGELPLYVVHFTDAQKKLRQSGPGELAVVLYRRMMVRVAARLARHEEALALVTGENLGQVASQTLENLSVIEDACPIPILRPLVTYDKLETVALAKRIGTFETSIQPYEDCCSLFVPRHPATRARLDDVRAAEAKLDVDALAEEMTRAAERIVVRG